MACKVPSVCAHGGLILNTSIMQNSLDALHLAVAYNVPCVELDVSLANDGVAMAMHPRQRVHLEDPVNTAAATAAWSKPEVFAYSSAELMHSAGFVSLHTMLEHACKSGSNAENVQTLIIDAKTPLLHHWMSFRSAYGFPSLDAHEAALADAIVAVVEQLNCQERVLLTSRSDAVLNHVTLHHQGGVKLMQVVSFGDEDIRQNASAAGVHWSALSLSIVRRFKHSAGLLLSSHVVNSQLELWRALRHQELDYIVSDAPLMAMRFTAASQRTCQSWKQWEDVHAEL